METKNLLKKHILIAEDNENLLYSIKFILRTNNYRVTTASDGWKALEKILIINNSINPIDLLITDLQMPILTGKELIDKLRHLNITVPILVITACRKDLELIKKIKHKGRYRYLMKPFTAGELINKVENILKE